MINNWRTSSHSNAEGNCVEMGWHTSSYSSISGDCVEMGWRAPSGCLNDTNCVEVGYRTSSYSEQGACVEVAPGSAVVGVRDTKDRGRGHFEVGAGAWEFFLRGVAAL